MNLGSLGMGVLLRSPGRRQIEAGKEMRSDRGAVNPAPLHGSLGLAPVACRGRPCGDRGSAR
jgi:hypothetical protein